MPPCSPTGAAAPLQHLCSALSRLHLCADAPCTGLFVHTEQDLVPILIQYADSPNKNPNARHAKQDQRMLFALLK